MHPGNNYGRTVREESRSRGVEESRTNKEGGNHFSKI